MGQSITLDPLLQALAPIPSHAIVALLCLVLAVWQIAGVKGTARHRAVGWLFVLGMAYVALSALFIHESRIWGRFSPIHILIPVTLFTLWRGVAFARSGRIADHRTAMLTLTVLALVITGAFTLLPGRILHSVLFAATQTP